MFKLVLLGPHSTGSPPPPSTCSNFLNSDLTVQTPPDIFKLVYCSVPTVDKRTVCIRLKCLLVDWSVCCLLVFHDKKVRKVKMIYQFRQAREISTHKPYRCNQYQSKMNDSQEVFILSVSVCFTWKCIFHWILWTKFYLQGYWQSCFGPQVTSMTAHVCWSHARFCTFTKRDLHINFKILSYCLYFDLK